MRNQVKMAGVVVLAGLLSACATTKGAVPQPFPQPPGRSVRSRSGAQPAAIAAAPAADDASAVAMYALISTALDLRGTPYRNGGSDPFGFDCSGFTQYVFAQHQIPLPREVREQFKAGDAIELTNLLPGDLLFFSTTERGASHVAIAIGVDEFVHAPSSNGVVRVERLSTKYWAERYVGARRVTRP